MDIGNYVEYKTGKYIICDIIADKAKILSPTLGKKFVKMVNLTFINHKPAKQVLYNGDLYIVTSLDTIISRTTNRVMCWSPENGNRVAILALAHDQV